MVGVNMYSVIYGAYICIYICTELCTYLNKRNKLVCYVLGDWAGHKYITEEPHRYAV